MVVRLLVRSFLMVISICRPRCLGYYSWHTLVVSFAAVKS